MVKKYIYIYVRIGDFCVLGFFSIIEGTEVTVDKVEKYVWGELLKV